MDDEDDVFAASGGDAFVVSAALLHDVVARAGDHCAVLITAVALQQQQAVVREDVSAVRAALRLTLEERSDQIANTS